jgi:hypothetical protein
MKLRELHNIRFRNRRYVDRLPTGAKENLRRRDQGNLGIDLIPVTASKKFTVLAAAPSGQNKTNSNFLKIGVSDKVINSKGLHTPIMGKT